MEADQGGHPLEPGLIFEIAQTAGLVVVREDRDKVAIRCPFHDDQTPSAFLSRSNVFFCSVCTQDRGWTAKEFAERLRVPWPYEQSNTKLDFGPAEARRVWEQARSRARNDDDANQDVAAYSYLARRGLLESWEENAFGILADNMSLHESVAWWPRSGYRIIAPLRNARGAVANVQGRCIWPAEKKAVFPKGSRAKGTVFASATGCDLLRGASSWERVILAEGLTDYLALSIYSPVPVVSAPGTGMAASAVGPWVKGLDVYIALDADPAGRSAVTEVARKVFACGGRHVRRIGWPGGCKDPCEVIQRFGGVEFEHYLRRVLEGAHEQHAA